MREMFLWKTWLRNTCMTTNFVWSTEDLFLLLYLETVRLLMSMKIDRIKDDKISWSEMYGDQNTAQYHTLEDEVNYAVKIINIKFLCKHESWHFVSP